MIDWYIHISYNIPTSGSRSLLKIFLSSAKPLDVICLKFIRLKASLTVHSGWVKGSGKFLFFSQIDIKRCELWTAPGPGWAVVITMSCDNNWHLPAGLSHHMTHTTNNESSTVVRTQFFPSFIMKLWLRKWTIIIIVQALLMDFKEQEWYYHKNTGNIQTFQTKML